MQLTTRAAAILIFLSGTGAHAMIAADFLERLNDQQRASYMDGAVEMAAYAFAAGGEARKATCTLDWYYRGRGPEQLANTLKAHRDLPVSGVLQALLRRVCTE